MKLKLEIKDVIKNTTTLVKLVLEVQALLLTLKKIQSGKDNKIKYSLTRDSHCVISNIEELMREIRKFGLLYKGGSK